MRTINEIILHCTDTPSDTTVDSIRAYHKSFGWSDIGYHYLIASNGNCYYGRPVEKVGAHCKGHNKYSIGVAYIGKSPTTLQLIGMAHICNILRRKYNISRGSISLHCDYNPHKTCPNFSKSDLDFFYSQLY